MFSNGLAIKLSIDDLSEKICRQAGWIPLLGKYVNVSNGLVADTIPIDISAFQEELVRKFNTFNVGVDEVFQFFLCLRSGDVNGNRDTEENQNNLIDLVKELCRPQYYKECVDRPFFQQKCSKMNKLLKKESRKNWDPQEFRELLEFLAEKRRDYYQLSLIEKIDKSEDSNNNTKEASVPTKNEDEKQEMTEGKKKFLEECTKIAVIDDGSNNTQNLKGQGKGENGGAKSLIVISEDKNKVSIINEVVQKLNSLGTFKLELKKQMNQTLFSFIFIGEDFTIVGKSLSQRQKAKESCCEEVLSQICQYIKNSKKNEENENQQLNKVEIEENSTVQLEVIDNTTNQQNNENINQESYFKVEEYFEEFFIYEGNVITIISYQIESLDDLQIIENKLRILEQQLGPLNSLELNPFLMIEYILCNSNDNNRDDQDQDCDSDESSQYMKQFRMLLEDILKITALLYEYDSIETSPCVIISDGEQQFFLKTIILYQINSGKRRKLVGKIWASNVQQAYICSAIELLYKIAYKYQDHPGETITLSQVISSLITEVQLKIQEYEEEEENKKYFLTNNQICSKILNEENVLDIFAREINLTASQMQLFQIQL